ncbi:GGDEF domain-containing protein [Acidisoma silvae]|uniref:diguanylate cyclase n=1 Tax=Acidisoma silvae TaxID=2802396 RepID=A0A964DYZ4_9PROT|nr:GGDEF domain-containing protein [Acidisoma silvae]MCB8875686.1 GGDEF domain-containing protein [Acidisoma silvae]
MNPPPDSGLHWLDLIHAPVFVLNVETGQVPRANAAFYRILPPASPVAPVALSDLLGDGAALSLLGFIAAMPRDGSRSTLSLTCPTANGPLMLIMHLKPMPGQPHVWVITVDDRTLFFQGGASGNSEDTFRGIIQELPIGIDILDSSLSAVFYNRYSDSIYLYDSYYDLDMTEWFERAFPALHDRGRARVEWTDALAALQHDPDQPQTMEWRVMCRDGEYRVLLNRVSKIGSHYTFIYWDITEQRRLENQLRTLAMTDTLTGLHNRRHFFEASETLLAQARAERLDLCLIILDIDHFKQINDTMGHRAGDDALIVVADRCRAALRPGDLLARFGGEEFTIVLTDIPSDEAQAVAERIRAAIADQPILHDHETFCVTASIGLAAAEPGMASMDQLVEKADKALYAAKRGGRNRVVVAAIP